MPQNLKNQVGLKESLWTNIRDFFFTRVSPGRNYTPVFCSVVAVQDDSISGCTVTIILSLPIWHVRCNDAELAQIAVRKVVSGRGPRDDGRRAGGLEGVDPLAGLAVITLNAGALVAAADHVVPVPGKAYRGDRCQNHSCASISQGRMEMVRGWDQGRLT